MRFRLYRRKLELYLYATTRDTDLYSFSKCRKVFKRRIFQDLSNEVLSQSTLFYVWIGISLIYIKEFPGGPRIFEALIGNSVQNHIFSEK